MIRAAGNNATSKPLSRFQHSDKNSWVTEDHTFSTFSTVSYQFVTVALALFRRHV